MRLTCPYCHKPAVVTHRREISARQADVYANCTNPDCNARSVFRISHVYDLTPPASTLLNALQEIIANLPDEERRALVQQYAPVAHQPKLI